MNKFIVKLLRWVARRVNVKYQALITPLYVMIGVVGPGKTLVIIMGIIKEMKAHQEHRRAKTGIRRQRSVGPTNSANVQSSGTAGQAR